MKMLPRQEAEETGVSLSTEAPKPPERRRNVRHMTILRVGTIVVDGRRELCLVRNISAGGIMAHVYGDYDVGTRLAVELKTGQQSRGRVTWVADGNIGIAFDVAINVAETLANPSVLPNGWRSRMPRVEIDRFATLRAGADIHWVGARDISQGGVKVETDQPLQPGSEVVLTLEDFRPVQAVVRWQKDGIAGIRFNQVLPFDDLMSWLTRRS